MFFRKPNKDKTAQPTWIPGHHGLETTQSPQLIGSVLSALEKKRTPLVLAQKGGASSPTILLGSTDKYLLIDAPVDWKLKTLTLRIQFRDHIHLECYFDTKIVYVKDDIIYAALPTRVHRLQRRASYRVEVPRGSHVAFAGQSRGDRFAVRNISASGMLFCSKNRQLARGTVLKDIDLLLTLTGKQAPKTRRITIPEGRIVRTFDDRETGQFCYGVAFECGAREESTLMTYIRQREIELAKAGAPS